ncbi:MAG: hypothetical protein ACTS73_08900 [Arsenophonus sp. NEOnobi-MAG3]
MKLYNQRNILELSNAIEFNAECLINTKNIVLIPEINIKRILLLSNVQAIMLKENIHLMECQGNFEYFITR